MEQKEKHSRFSSIREEYVEYLFLSELCSHAWMIDRFVEVARSNTDAFGYDIILTCEGNTRHVQLKATRAEGRRPKVTVNSALENAPSGCVVWLFVDDHKLTPIKYGWFGAGAMEKLPNLGDKVAKHTKANADGEKSPRSATRELRRAKFEWFDQIEQVFERLFPTEVKICQP